MKLPTDKKQRMQIFALIGIGAVILIYVLFSFVWTPFQAKKKEIRETIAQLTEQIDKAEAEIRLMDRDHRANIEALQKIKELSDRCILKPRLTSYLLAARDVIDKHAENMGLTLEVKEGGISDIISAPSGGKTVPPLKIYTAYVMMNAGYNDAVRLLRALEQENELLCVSSMSILGDSSKPDTHKIIFYVQWPIWTDSSMSDKLNEMLKAATEAAGIQGGGHAK